MRLIDANDLLSASWGLDRFRGSLVSKLIMYILRLNKLDKLSTEVDCNDPEQVIDSLIEALGVTVEINEEDLEKIQKE